MESDNHHTMPFHNRRAKDDEMIRRIDQRLSEETSLHDGLVWGVEHGFLSADEAEACEKAFHEAYVPPTID